MIPRTRAPRPAFMWCLIACAAFWTPAARAQAVSYLLSLGSEFRTGCFVAPCVCPQIQDAMTGSMVLVRQPPEPQFAHYQVVGIDWVVQFPEGFVSIVGSGSFRVGGAPVLQQQMTLDVSIGGAPVVHLDSGLVPGGDNFPRLDVPVSLYGAVACIDTVLLVRG